MSKTGENSLFFHSVLFPHVNVCSSQTPDLHISDLSCLTNLLDVYCSVFLNVLLLSLCYPLTQIALEDIIQHYNLMITLRTRETGGTESLLTNLSVQFVLTKHQPNICRQLASKH